MPASSGIHKIQMSFLRLASYFRIDANEVETALCFIAAKMQRNNHMLQIFLVCITISTIQFLAYFDMNLIHN